MEVWKGGRLERWNGVREEGREGGRVEGWKGEGVEGCVMLVTESQLKVIRTIRLPRLLTFFYNEV